MSLPIDTQTLSTAKPVAIGLPRAQSLLARRTARAQRRAIRGF